jgi:hypothetical protein
MTHFGKALLIGLLISSELFGLVVPPEGNHPTIRVVRVEGGTESEHKAYQLFGKKLQRWMDDLASGARVVSMDGSVSAQTLTFANQLDRLEHDIEGTISVLEKGEPSAISSSISHLKETLSELPDSLKAGPHYQRALLCLAAASWSLSDRLTAVEEIRRAISVHPELKLEHLGLWETDSRSPLWTSFDAEIDRVAHSISRQCGVRVLGMDQEGTLYVNGFPCEGNSNFRLMAGESYSFQYVDGIKLRDSISVLCKGAGLKIVKFSPQGHPQFFALASQKALSGQADSTLVVEPVKGEFKLFFYSTLAGLDEVPLTSPIRVADLLESPLDNHLSIESDAFKNLIDRHSESSLSVVAANEPPQSLGQPPLPTPQGLRENESSRTQWYNDWKFWAIVGGIAGAATITYLVSRDRPPQNQQGGVSILLH